MKFMDQTVTPTSEWSRLDRLERQMRDYGAGSLRLIWQRQAIFFGAILLTAFYFDPGVTFICYSVILVTEFADLTLARKITRWHNGTPAEARRFLALILCTTIFSAIAICAWVVIVAQQQGVGGHFMPLFFLFAAALFAAMNNHQVLPALIVRLAIYGLTFF